MNNYRSGPGLIWTGSRREITNFDGIPRGWFPEPMPDLGENELAIWRGGRWRATIHAYIAPPARSDVNEERDRRLDHDFEFQEKMFQRDIAAVRRINGAGTLALAAIVGGAQLSDYRWHGEDSDFSWIASDNSIIKMDAQTVMAFGAAAAKRETELIFSAKALKSQDPIPSDFTDDKHWP